MASQGMKDDGWVGVNVYMYIYIYTYTHMYTHVGGAVAGGVVVVPVDTEDGEAHRVVGVLVVYLPKAVSMWVGWMYACQSIYM